MYNVLDKKKEIERQVYENEYFMLGKDWEFNEGDIKTLYCLALVKQRDPPLYTLRDLTQEHLPLLKSIRDESLEAIESRFGVPKT